MAKKKTRVAESRPAASEEKSPADFGPRTWAALTVLGALSACVSLFLWMELVLLRTGGSSFCAGSGGRLDCASVWNGGFASAVHRLTGLPVAGWGLVWSAAAFLLPLTGLLRASQARARAAIVSATQWTAAAGAVGIVVMIAASVAAGALCVGCLATDLIVAVYAFLALRGWRGRASTERARGLGVAAAIAAGAFLVLLYPGLHTPKSSGQAGLEAISAVGSAAGTTLAGPSSSSSTPAPAPATAPAASAPASSAGTGDPRRDKELVDLVTSLDPALKQTLADSLAIYRNSRVRALSPPRALVGSDLAPVRITEFTDILCEHCATLHQTLKAIRENVAPGSFSVDARQYPLDGRCNSRLEPRQGEDVRCLAAKIRICAEPTGKEPAVADALFSKQQGLTHSEALRIAGQILPAATLGACLDAPGTAAKLQSDVDAAAQFDSDGTPIVVVNGRQGTSFGPFLFAMVLTGGNPEHPAFEALPPGNPAAHLH